MSTIWWVRHAPTGRRAMIGWTDLPARFGDTASLARLAERLPVLPCAASDLSRAHETARRIRGTRPWLGTHPGLREIHFGAWEGLTATEAEARDGARLRRFFDDPATPAPGGESWQMFAARVARAVTGLMARREAADGLVIVAHMGVIMAEIARATGASPRAAMGHDIPPLSVTRLDYARHRADFIARAASAL